MKEEDIKKILSKSEIETSDDFINKLMNRIEVEKEHKKIPFLSVFKPVLAVCAILGFIVILMLTKLLDIEFNFLNVPSKTPILIVATFVFLYFINNMIRMNEKLAKSEL